MSRRTRKIRIAVCIKQVPDTSELQIDPETNTLIRQGVEAVLNPLDEFAIEAGLRLREALAGELTAFTMGPQQASEVLEKALAMGADHGILLCDKAFAGADTWATSLTLARALKQNGPFDAIFAGKQAIDGDTGQVGPGIAAHLGIPQVTNISEVVSADEEGVEVKRMLDTGTAHLRAAFPVVLTALKEANEPRLPTLAGRLRALHSSAQTSSAETLGLSAEDTGLNGSPTRVVKIDVPRPARKRKTIEGPPASAARNLFTHLQEDGCLLK